MATKLELLVQRWRGFRLGEIFADPELLQELMEHDCGDDDDEDEEEGGDE